MPNATREGIYINVQGGRSFTDTSTSVWPPTPANANQHATNQSSSRQRHTTVSEGKIDSTTFLLIIETQSSKYSEDETSKRSSRAESINVGAGLVWIYIILIHCIHNYFLSCCTVFSCGAGCGGRVGLITHWTNINQGRAAGDLWNAPASDTILTRPALYTQPEHRDVTEGQGKEKSKKRGGRKCKICCLDLPAVLHFENHDMLILGNIDD